MDILALGYYRAKRWPPKPLELVDLQELLSSSQKRKEKHMDMIDVYKIKDRIMEDEQIKKYMELLSMTKCENYGNYDWVLTLRKEETDSDKIQKLDEMIREFRMIYWSGEVPNLPATRIIQEDYDNNVRIKQENQSKDLVDKLKETFGGTIIE